MDVRKAIAVSVLVLGSMLLGALTPGVAAAATDSVATTTAGIELGTAPVIRAAANAAAHAALLALRPLFSLFRLLVAVTVVLASAGLVLEVPSGLRSLLRSRAGTRRGPPLLA